MRRLTPAIKRRIVEHLACYCTHSEVAELIANEFGITLTPRHVRAYDPMSFQFAGSEHWTEFHKKVRANCDKELGEIAISHRAYRLRQLQQIHDRARSAEDYALAVKILEQAAKEMGNCFRR